MIKALVMDVDGTLTDGGIFMGNTGELMKRFHVRDGYGIHDMLPRMGILPIILTGRESDIVYKRCSELGIKYIIQGSKDKAVDLKTILLKERVSMKEAAYIGDDLNDLECMKQTGLIGCPNDAVFEIKKIADYVCNAAGGNGAVREFIEWIGKNT